MHVLALYSILRMCCFLTILLLGNIVLAARTSQDHGMNWFCICRAISRSGGQLGQPVVLFARPAYSKFSLLCTLFVLFGCSFSRTPAEHSLICLALSHAARRQPICDSSSALGSNKKAFSFICVQRGFLKAREDAALPELYSTKFNYIMLISAF